MHRLKWSVIAKQSVCLEDPISMLLSQLLSQLRSQFSSASFGFEAIGMEIVSSSRLLAPWKASFTGADNGEGGARPPDPHRGVQACGRGRAADDDNEGRAA